jgi:superfamily II DNA/RNA helicase
MNRPYFKKRKDNNSSGRSGFNGGYRNSKPRTQFQSKRQIGSFNPSHLVQEAKEFAPQEEFIPQNQFKDFALEENLQENITQKNYVSPTPIQDQAIPAMLEGRDVIGIANTGTGKTAAFLIPLINKVLQNKSKKVIILAPTRELAVQIRDEFEQFSKGMNIYSVLLIGGVKSSRQKMDLRNEYNFVIGTPGRVKDMIQDRKLNLQLFDSVVLDEADHMVDIGFIHDVKFFISLLPERRQSLFFSATIDGKVKEILASFVRNPVTITVKTHDTVDNIEQNVIKVESSNRKIDQLHDLLIQKNYEKVIIFGRTKWGVQKVSDELVRRGFRAGAIHGNKNQNQRQRTLTQFKRNEISILLATDVAARGLDIDDVSHVINYDMPASYEDYIHRIGRTGRANKKGTALTFIG